MRLTLHTDYAFRVLMALARAPEQVQSVEDLAREFSVSKHHLMKVAQNLTAGGFVATVRGRNGGLRLAMPARDINLKSVALHMEPDFNIADCFGNGQCSFLPRCGLKGVLGEARHAFLQTLGRHDLASII
ncbi:Rrf2 family transcriptional regulator [Hoeflea sp. YIM 152468]|uniref:RrF2 family transcriptional regulator n=1 Tax=Hoeflea sp. YIM 152468 TaxID=3031759 RepID=UPI0023DC57BC|nr:Rrf2 family transcriptional regulator [Hoeflea sp. YIM 152468]MDF1608431.1 Rrf2 family transcriptional regulator [Hoeflea sp. YIM 152468]